MYPKSRKIETFGQEICSSHNHKHFGEWTTNFKQAVSVKHSRVEFQNVLLVKKFHNKLDVDPRRDDDASPMSS